MIDCTMVEFGPVRTMGVRYVGKNEHAEIPQLWDNELIPRVGELGLVGPTTCFGVCRCTAETSDGFEYLALAQVDESTSLPAGMVEHVLPRCTYLVVPVANLSRIHEAWNDLPSKLTALDGWAPFCGPDGCHCDEAASFEYYPPDFSADGPLWLYVPVRPEAP